ncbi:hypothetical protein N4G70_11315 [Streptomyces sp. ASQP_92]|uniref:hypothetical protein n=1 Tax=Streptomyces sp. ASQP_92 TaxID=2979116 RepID=UPI0021BE90EA|nr:hypothetical protein [Streptomyces sp. ASQP_92]MCT9089459.1 hypothetical protein [Streptomyces sp. ASQP_92]
MDSPIDRADEFVEVAAEYAEYAVDTANGNRIGVVQDRFEGSVYLRPPGGGVEWATPPEALRSPSAAELVQARVFDTPVEARRP